MNQSTYENHEIHTKQRTKKEALVTFLDDDGKAEVYSLLYPIFKAKGLPFSACIVTGKLDTLGVMTSEQVRELISEGHEILGHTHNAHSANMKDYSLKYLKNDTLKCRESLRKLGSNSRGFVYPQGRSSIAIKRIVQKEFDFAFGATGINKDENVEKMKLKRLGFGMWGSGDDLEAYKAQIDYLVENGGWLTYMLHTGVGPTAHEELTLLPELILYIQSKGIKIVNASEGYALYGSGKKRPILLRAVDLAKETILSILYRKPDLLKKTLKLKTFLKL